MRTAMTSPVYFVLILMLVGHITTKNLECEVCEKFLQTFVDSLSSEDTSDTSVVEDKLRKMCKSAKGKENRFCYYVGGLEESATKILGEISKPVSYSLPAKKICERLHKKDAQICELRYDKTIDFKTVDLNKLKVKDLKKILNDWGEECKGCAEKSDFIALINKLKPKYVREDL